MIFYKLTKTEEESYKDIAQYECTVCSDSHYHTRRKVGNIGITLIHRKPFDDFPLKMTIDEQRGYEFSNPIPEIGRAHV